MSDKDNNKDDFLFEDDDELSSFMSELDDSKGTKQDAKQPEKSAAEPEIVEEPEEHSFSSPAAEKKDEFDDFDFSWDDEDDFDTDLSFDDEPKNEAATAKPETPDFAEQPTAGTAVESEPAPSTSFEPTYEEEIADNFAPPAGDEAPEMDFDSGAESDSHYFSDDLYQQSDSGFMGSVKEFAANNSRILIVVGIAVAAIIGLKWFFSPTSDQQKLLSAPKVPAAVVAKPQQPVPAQIQPSVSEKRLDSMNTALKGNKNDLQALRSDVTRLQSRFTSSDHVMEQLSSQLHELQSTNQQLVAQVKLLEQREQDRLKKQEYKKTHYVHYHVQALEEGRAWLMGSNGLLTSVSVGSQLEHYGEVLSIDVDNAVVVTSSGETIGYKQDAMDSEALR